MCARITLRTTIPPSPRTRSDKHTWIGTDEAPLPYDAQYNAKPAYAAMLAALQA